MANYKHSQFHSLLSFIVDILFLGIFAVAFVVLLFAKIDEPISNDSDDSDDNSSMLKNVFKFRHFKLGILAIFLYMGLEVGPPTYMLQYLTADTQEMINKKEAVLTNIEGKLSKDVAREFHELSPESKEILTKKRDVYPATSEGKKDSMRVAELEEDIMRTTKQIDQKQLTKDIIHETEPGLMMNATIAGGIVAIYWLLMLIGRLIGGMIGAKVSSRTQVTVCATSALILVLLGIFLPKDITFNMPGIKWETMEVLWGRTPISVLCFILVGLFTSVMWGGIFNMAVEGLGKYTSIASGLFMTMVFGGAILVPLQGWVADTTNSYITSFIIPILCGTYILFYALIGSRISKKAKAQIEA